MDKLSLLVGSSVGRKLLNGLTGFFLIIFIAAHLGGNLNILLGPDAFNGYAVKLWSLGPLVYVIEAGLALLFLVHAFMGTTVFIDKLRGRPEGYRVQKSAGAPSRQTISSKTMIYTGALLFAFLVWHLWQFRFGPHYTTMYHGQEARDLYRLVVEVYSSVTNVIIYEVLMILLGVHLWHGFWSAFQTLGVSNPKYANPIHTLGYFVAVIVAFGFLSIPPYIYFTGGAQ